jgi:hypothetical protein
VVLPHDRLLPGGIDPEVGNPAPSLKVVGYGSVPFRLAVAAGARTLTVDVLQPEAAAVRAWVKVRRNDAVGVTTDLTQTTAAGTGWQQVQLAFTATANGAVVIELGHSDPGYRCWFDNLQLV